MSPLNAQSTIQLTLRGLLAIFADDKECTVGLLRKTPPHHELKITVNKAVAGGSYKPFLEIKQADIKSELKLEVKNKTGIYRRKENAPIDRNSGPTLENNDSFRWVVDFEKDIYSKPIGAKKAGFISILTLNNGELLARQISLNKLLTRKGHAGPWEEFGFVACETGIDIVLDQPNSSVVFTNGGKVVFESDPQSSYQIFIDRGPAPAHHHPSGNDADFYYTAIGHLIPNGDKKFFSSTPLPNGVPLPVTPDAVCFNGGGGGSKPTD